MSRRKTASASGQSDAPPRAAVASTPLYLLTIIAFLLAVGLVACRMLMLESIRSPVDALATARSASANGLHAAAVNLPPRSPGPAAGLTLDMLFCLPALLVLIRRALDGNYRLLPSWSHIPMGLLGLLAIVSPLWAADKFSSLVSASHLFCAMVLLWAMSQLVRDWLALRIIAAVCIGLLLTLELVGWNYHTFELRDLHQMWEQDKARILQEHGWTEGSYQAQNFEKRIINGQPQGFTTSTNTYAALLVLLGVISGGVVIQKICDGGRPGAVIVGVLVPVGAIAAGPAVIHWTACRAAYITPIMAGLILLVIALLGRWLARIWRTIFLATVAGVCVGTVLVIRHGLKYGNLWHDSLTFRWRYWTGAYSIATTGLLHRWPREYGGFLIGVGWENFGPYYLGHRLAVATEEIRDPHNFIIRVIIELGVVGGVLLLIWLVRLWWELSTPLLPGINPHESRHAILPASGRAAVVGIASIAVVAIAVNIVESVDFKSDINFVIFELFRRGIFLVILLVGIGFGCLRRKLDRVAPDSPADISLEPDDRPAPWVLYAILAAIGTFLIHNLIEFSLFEPGPLFMTAMLIGAALGIRSQAIAEQAQEPANTGRKWTFKIIAGLAGIPWLAACVLVAAPVALGESLADAADADTIASFATKNGPLLGKAADEMIAAHSTVPYNSEYAHRAAELLISAGQRIDSPQLRKMLDAAVSTDPSSVQNLTLRAHVELLDPAQFDAGLRDYRRAITLDPRNVRLRLDFARELTRVAGIRHDAGLASSADFEFVAALDNDAQLPAEEVKRLTPAELADAHRDQEQARNLARGVP